MKNFLERFLHGGGNPKKEHFVLQGGTLRFIFSEHFVLRIIYLCQQNDNSANLKQKLL